MKKTFLTLFVASFFIAMNVHSQSKANVTLKQVLEANKRQAIAARHKNWHIYIVPANSLKKSEQVKAYGCFSYMAYNEPDMMYFEEQSEGMKIPGVQWETGLYTRNETYWNDYNADGTESLSIQWFAMTPEEKKKQTKGLDDFSIVEYSEGCGEVAVSAVDNGDGTILFTTNAPASQVGDIWNLPSKWKKLTVEYKYLLDAKTLECKSIDANILTKKGKIEYFSEEINYDIDYSGNPNLKKLRDFEKKVLAQKPQKPRTATIIYNPGTSKEETFTKTSDMSYQVYMHFRNGYKAFDNPELTVPFTGSKGRDNFTVYLVPEEGK